MDYNYSNSQYAYNCDVNKDKEKVPWYLSSEFLGIVNIFNIFLFGIMLMLDAADGKKEYLPLVLIVLPFFVFLFMGPSIINLFLSIINMAIKKYWMLVVILVFCCLSVVCHILAISMGLNSYYIIISLVSHIGAVILAGIKVFKKIV